MSLPRSATVLLLAGLAAALPLAAPASGEPSGDPVDFNRDVKPILSENCFLCHGFDASTRKARLRLDTFEGATQEVRGFAAVVPGDREESELWYRITTEDADDRMPPVEHGKSLTPEQVEVLGRWIDQGAAYEEHWAFVPPARAAAPAVRDAAWARNPLDRFVLARLEQEGLAPAPEADRATLLRRASLDLTGLPPSLDAVDAFLADPAPDAFERAVDRLLASPAHGEHAAREWLDAARYGDTHGLHLDNERTMWPYRDWVIRAFQENKPYDEFVVEQLAGDLLPEPSTAQLVATGFNRCNVTSAEGGMIAEEFLAKYAMDRVDTTATVFLGATTTACWASSTTSTRRPRTRTSSRRSRCWPSPARSRRPRSRATAPRSRRREPRWRRRCPRATPRRPSGNASSAGPSPTAGRTGSRSRRPAATARCW
jgi:hypothetical protein